MPPFDAGAATAHNGHAIPTRPAAVMSDVSRALRRLRLVRGMKQAHLAELLGVTQVTVSRWERGACRVAPGHEARLRRLLEAPLDPSADAALKRLVTGSPRPVHLICDLSHRLLAASPARAAEWDAPASAFLGRPLLPYAAPAILEAEARLAELGWYDRAEPSVVVAHGGNGRADLRIAPGRTLWERIVLADGTVARLVTTLPADSPTAADGGTPRLS